jgi:hypothetical protein
MGVRRYKHWGWGFEDEQPGPEELRGGGRARVLIDR